LKIPSSKALVHNAHVKVANYQKNKLQKNYAISKLVSKNLKVLKMRLIQQKISANKYGKTYKMNTS